MLLVELPLLDLSPADVESNRRVVQACKTEGVCGEGCINCCVVPELPIQPPEKEGDPSSRKERWKPCDRLTIEIKGTRRIARCTLHDQKGARDDLAACARYKGNLPNGRFTLAEGMNHHIADDILSKPVSFLFTIEMFLNAGLLDPDILEFVRCRLEASEDETDHLLHRLLIKNDTGKLPRALIVAIGLPGILARLQPAWRHMPGFQPCANPLHAEFLQLYIDTVGAAA